uniref:Protein kinase domain-containing protein n=1 Tax=Xiphophorus couchianus TaxID=32473 RepID=A0A3B5MEX6_9TELE
FCGCEGKEIFDLLKMSVFGSKPEFNLQKNTVLVSKTNQFVVEDLMARGGYGCVVKCRKVETEEMVAVKLVKRSQYDSGVNEMKIFKTLRQFKGGNTNIVKFLEHFEHNNHFCLAFEMLDINLYEYIRCRYFFPLDINEIRVLAQQLLVALKVLKELRVTHRDIKCDNIMLVDRASQPLRVKLIDFGLSTRTYSMRNYVFKQPLSYRSPDVILDFPLDEAIDMWGLGCVLAFLYLGRHLFPSRAEYETLSVMLKLLGKPHDTLLTFGLSTERFFKCVKGEFTCLDDLQKKRPESKDPLEKRDLLSFIDLLKKMLDMNPSRRIAPLKALNHEFITMAHLSLRTLDPQFQPDTKWKSSQGAVENRGRFLGPQGSGGEQGSLGSVLQDETGPEGEHWQQVMSSGEIGGQGTETGQAGEDKPRQEAGTGSGPEVRRGLGEAGESN